MRLKDYKINFKIKFIFISKNYYNQHFLSYIYINNLVKIKKISLINLKKVKKIKKILFIFS